MGANFLVATKQQEVWCPFKILIPEQITTPNAVFLTNVIMGKNHQIHPCMQISRFSRHAYMKHSPYICSGDSPHGRAFSLQLGSQVLTWLPFA